MNKSEEQDLIVRHTRRSRHSRDRSEIRVQRCSTSITLSLFVRSTPVKFNSFNSTQLNSTQIHSNICIEDNIVHYMHSLFYPDFNASVQLCWKACALADKLVVEPAIPVDRVSHKVWHTLVLHIVDIEDILVKNQSICFSDKLTFS